MPSDPIEQAFTSGAVAALRATSARYAKRAEDGACASDKSPGVVIRTAEAAMAVRQSSQVAALADELEHEAAL